MKTIYVCLLIAGLVTLTLGGTIYSIHKTGKSHLISEYSCEAIDQAISGQCLIKYQDIWKHYCFDSSELYVYYKLKCVWRGQMSADPCWECGEDKAFDELFDIPVFKRFTVQWCFKCANKQLRYTDYHLVKKLKKTRSK
jgi:hypothetical protein